jgi:hypothetical protein
MVFVLPLRSPVCDFVVLWSNDAGRASPRGQRLPVGGRVRPRSVRVVCCAGGLVLAECQVEFIVSVRSICGV